MVWASLVMVLVSLVQPQTGTRGRPPSKPVSPPAYLKAIQSRQDQGNKARLVLRSGVTVLIEEQPVHPLIAIQSAFVGGSAGEAQTEQGYARLLAGLLFHGGGFADGIQKVAGTASVEVRSDVTIFASVVPSENLAKALDVHAALLTFPELTPELAERERQLLETRPAHQESALEGVRRKLGNQPDSSAAALPSPDLAKLRRFHDRACKRPNLILSLAGGLIREQMLEKLVQLYGKGQAPAARTRARDQWKPGPAFSYQFSQGPVAQPFVFLSYRVPGADHPDYYPLVLISYALGHGFGSILERHVVERQPEAVQGDCRLDAGPQGEALQIQLVPLEKQLDAAEISTLAEIELIRDEGLKEDQLTRAKALLLCDVYRGLETLEGRAGQSVRFEIAGNGLDRDGIIAKIAALSPDDIRRAARQYLGVSNLTLLELMPESAEARTFTSETYLDALHTLLPGVLTRVTEARELPIEGDEVSLEAAVKFKPKYLKYELRKTSVIRGPEVYYQEDHSLPLVHLGLFYTGGRGSEAAGKRGLTEVMLRSLLHRGLHRKNAPTAFDLEQMGAAIDLVNEPDLFGLQTTVLAPHLAPVLKSYIEWLRQATIEEADVEFAKKRTLSLLASEQAQGVRNIDALVWKDSPYAFSRYGTVEDVGSLDLATVDAWRKNTVGQIHPVIVLRGDVQGSSFLEGLVRALSDRRYKAPEIAAPEDSQPLRASAQAPGLLLFAGPGLATREERTLDVIESITGGPGGTLADEIWDREGLGFPDSLTHTAHLKGGTIQIVFDSPEAKRAATAQGIMKQLSLLKEQPLRSDLFLGGLSRSIARYYMARQDGAGFVRDLALYVFTGGSANWETEFVGAIKDLQPEDIKSFAAEYFVQDGGSQ